VASVDDVESHLNTQELVEKSVEPKPITMTRAEVYAMHGTLMKEADAIVSVLPYTRYMSNAPSLDRFRERHDASHTTGTWRRSECAVSGRPDCTCHLCTQQSVRPSHGYVVLETAALVADQLSLDDPLAAGKADWVQAKRHILAVLRVQTGTTMIDVLTAPVTEEQEWMWEDVVRQDLHRDQVRNRKSQLPPVPNQGNDYRLEDIRS
jgi:Ras GTPase-activating-like protein IQGAP2/3